MRATAARSIDAQGTRRERDPGIIQSLYRGLQMLEDLVVAERPLRLRDFVSKYGVDRASAFRFLATLEKFGVAGKDASSKAYTRGGKLIAWLAAANHELRLVPVVRPHLERLARETRETGHTAVLSGDQALLVDYIPSPTMVTVGNRVGVHEPLYCSAVGRALLAFLPDAERERLIGRIEFVRHTPRTIGGAAALRKELARVRRDGVAIDPGEYHDLLMCIAAPLLGGEGQVLGSIGISMIRPLFRQTPGRLKHLAEAVIACGARASAELAGGARRKNP
jgi:IclR family acetate operon transcriptional repressor